MHTHEAAREKIFRSERSVGFIRLGIIALGTLVYYTVFDRGLGIDWLAQVLLASAWAYGVSIVAFEPYRRYPILLQSYFTAVTDAVFTMAWLYATGGIHSPFYVALYAAVAGVALRYNLRETVAAAGIYAGSYLLLLLALGQVSGFAAEVIVRLSYIFFIAAMVGLLSREAFDQTKEKHEIRAIAQRLDEELRERERVTKALSAEKERYESLLHAQSDLGDGLAITEGERIVHVNDALCRIYGYSREELLQFSSFLDLVVPEERQRLQERLSRRRRGDAVDSDQGETRVIRKDGRVIDIEYALKELRAGERMQVFSIIRDITARKSAEEDRRVAHEALREVEALKEVDRFKTRFINTAAHELRTPLTPIKLQLHLLKTLHAGDLSPEGRRSLEVLNRNLDRLEHLVGDLLEAARLQARGLGVNRAELDLNAVVREAVESFEASADAAGIALILETGPAPLNVHADPQRITQVMFNLLSNALKFTGRGGRIRVATRHGNGQATVEVCDTGVGIPQGEAHRLFQPFSQLHEGLPVAQGGTGLGLYISKGILELHGGVIWCRSEGLGEGATFGFALPIRPHAPHVGLVAASRNRSR